MEGGVRTLRGRRAEGPDLKVQSWECRCKQKHKDDRAWRFFTMFENRSIAFAGLLGLLISFIVIGSLTGQQSSESELAFDSPVCLQPSVRAHVVRPSAPVPVFAKKGSSGHELPLNLSFARLGKNNVGKNLSYAIGLRPAQNDGTEATVVAKGQVYAGQDTVRETIAIKNLTAGASYELTVEVTSQANGTLGQDLGKDIVYVTAVHGSKEREPLSLEFSEAADFWNNWLSNIYLHNLTIPTVPLPPNDEPLNCSICSLPDSPSLFTPSTPTGPVLLRPTPIGGAPEPGPRSKVSYRVNVRVRWEDFSSGSATFPGFAGATVWIYIHSMDDESRTLYGHSSMTLNSAGRASATVKIPRDQYIALITVAFDNRVMRFVTGNQAVLHHFGRSGGIEYPLKYRLDGDEDGGTMEVDEIIRDSYGPGLVRMWNEFNGIWRQADALVGMWDVPKLNVLYPSDWSRYPRGQNTIQIWGAVGWLSADHFAHELGHHVMYSVARGIPGQGGEHGVCDGAAYPRGLAFSEGWATAFAATVLGRQVIANLDYGAYDCATETDMVTSEGRVAAGLIDLVDDGGGAAECNGGNVNLGRNGVCDNTIGGQLFTPRLVFRDSVAGVVDQGVDDWWRRIESTYRSRVGFLAGRDAMEYNYYPQECWGWILGICIRRNTLINTLSRILRSIRG